MRGKGGTPRYAPLVVIVVLFVALELIWPATSIYNMIVTFVVGAVLIAVLRSNLIGRMLRGATVFTAIYLVLFAYFLVLYVEFIERYYNTEHLLGVFILGIPVEELLFAFSGGAVWSVIYEYMQSYRLVSMMPVKFARKEAAALRE